MKNKKYITNIIQSASPPLSMLKIRAERGGKADVRFIMKFLHREQSFFICKQIDYCLDLITSPGGIKELKKYLFTGELIQRNYAALYFKRRNQIEILRSAVEEGCIDEVQAFSR